MAYIVMAHVAMAYAFCAYIVMCVDVCRYEQARARGMRVDMRVGMRVDMCLDMRMPGQRRSGLYSSGV